jgi:hypothetical protein
VRCTGQGSTLSRPDGSVLESEKYWFGRNYSQNRPHHSFVRYDNFSTFFGKSLITIWIDSSRQIVVVWKRDILNSEPAGRPRGPLNTRLAPSEDSSAFLQTNSYGSTPHQTRPRRLLRFPTRSVRGCRATMQAKFNSSFVTDKHVSRPHKWQGPISGLSIARLINSKFVPHTTTVTLY